MTRAGLTEKLLDIKRDKGWTWKYICEEIGGMSPVLITGAILGQMKLTKPQAAKAGELFGLSKGEQALLNEVPSRGSPMPPTDPLIYRFYELVMVNGPALKVLIEEEFGDGIMSAIDFDMTIDRVHAGCAGQSHTDAQLVAHDLDRAGNTRLPAGAETVNVSAAAHARTRAERERAGEILARTDAAIEHDLDVGTERLDDRRQHGNRGRRAIELAAAMIGHH